MSTDNSQNVNNTEQDCAVCLQKCHYPTQLPCGHIFCFLCVKGVAIQSRKCAMCRARIPRNYLDHPVLLEKQSPQENADNAELEYQWYYEGRNGWWKYDERSNVELESAFSNGNPECSLLLAGAVYNIDFQSMTQIRRNDQTRRRRVRRDTPQFPAKGIAGIWEPTQNYDENNPQSNNEVTSDGAITIDSDDESDGEVHGVENEGVDVEDFLINVDSVNRFGDDMNEGDVNDEDIINEDTIDEDQVISLMPLHEVSNMLSNFGLEDISQNPSTIEELPEV